MSDRQFNLLLAALRITLGVVIAINITLTTWLCTTAVDQGKELSAITANRFTAENGLGVWREIAAIREAMPKEVPPIWFIERVDRLESTLTQRIKDVEDHVEKLHNPY